MIDADISGKLRADGSNAHIRSEDLLTSTVFGLLRYFTCDQVMLPLMQCVRCATLCDGKLTVGPQAPTDSPWLNLQAAATCDIEFWPSFGMFGQPDILLTFRDARRAVVHLVLVEAKLHSPKSGEAEEDDDDDALTSAADADESRWHADQLVKYWRGLLQHPGAPASALCSVVYLTAHPAPPVPDLLASLIASPSMRLGWISWRDIWHVTSPLAQSSLAANDLTRLLANRGFKALDAFKYAVPTITHTGRFWQQQPWFRSIALPASSAKTQFWEAS